MYNNSFTHVFCSVKIPFKLLKAFQTSLEIQKKMQHKCPIPS